VPSTNDDQNGDLHRAPAETAGIPIQPVPDGDAVPVLVSRDYSRLRALSRLWLNRDDPVGRALADKLNACRVVRPDAVPASVAVLGAHVVFAPAGGAPECRLLVMPEEYVEDGERLAVSSPLGAALLGAAAGQWVEAVERDGRRIAVRLLAVNHGPGLLSLAGGRAGPAARARWVASNTDEDEDPPPSAA
jgi:regulator of nucleoside diphosphate kinase